MAISDEDTKILVSVCKALDELDELDNTDVEVMVEKSQVHLTGTVPNHHQKRLAFEVAANVEGVQLVTGPLKVKRVNHLDVGPPDENKQPIWPEG